MGKYNISIIPASSKSLPVCVLLMCLLLSQAAAGMNDDENILNLDLSKILEEYKTRLSSPSLLHQRGRQSAGGIYYPDRSAPGGPDQKHHKHKPTPAPAPAPGKHTSPMP
ncbi:unnamed protein product [Cuscuta europaea]|uniref:Uncharacterized protein n=1 Tax=Cuscuta europaea TaxID=41803 RepID=A0A9P1EDL7_CUSEU|nr:unnamed protein product [Cuscuta europaea]